MNLRSFKVPWTVLLLTAFFSVGLTHTEKASANLLSREQVLGDSLNRVSKDFKISKNLKNRVGFWFDIYSKYTSKQNVIHHRDYPWLVYKVVDSAPIYKGKGHYWTKYHKAKKEVSRSKARIRQVIKQLLAKKNFRKLNTEQRYVYRILKQIPGKRRKVLKRALVTVRAQLGQKDFIQKGLVASAKYLPHMESIFRDKKLPPELTRIPFVESSFNIRAYSKVGASGIWQFMPNIGKHYLKMNRSVDERNSPIKATYGATKLLKQNYRTFKNWSLAVTAYNFGSGRLNKIKKRYKKNNIGYYIAKLNHPSFGFASMNFYTSFLGALYAEKYKEHLFKGIQAEPLLNYVAIKLKKPMRLSKIYKDFKLNKSSLEKFNLDIKKKTFKRNAWLPKGYILHIPPTSFNPKNTKTKRALYKLVYKSESLNSI